MGSLIYLPLFYYIFYKEPPQRLGELLKIIPVKQLCNYVTTNLLVHELNQCHVNLCCLSETRIPDVGISIIPIPACDRSYTLYNRGTIKQGHNGVGIAVIDNLVPFVSGYAPVNDRIMLLSLQCKPLDVTIVAVYAPTNDASDAD